MSYCCLLVEGSAFFYVRKMYIYLIIIIIKKSIIKKVTFECLLIQGKFYNYKCRQEMIFIYAKNFFTIWFLIEVLRCRHAYRQVVIGQACAPQSSKNIEGFFLVWCVPLFDVAEKKSTQLSPSNQLILLMPKELKLPQGIHILSFTYIRTPIWGGKGR